ncbi:hypothetical protein L9F63_014229 [Diploptera punctata]|uniref:Nuclear receptor-binding factor 2 MIT domain-containing protein n=1 Tax=Diploptera punctata TaxID=6984 RepID=A0AAD8AAI5_DIPPU|nr:hypothetical protein L9F63_014229 [Diploptera punctata]
MEFMETFPLNVAHQLERRAEFYLERKHYDESIQCYQKAVQKLKEAEQKSNDKLFIQSVRYQQERCIQLQKIVSMKKTRYLTERARQQNILAKLEQTSSERSQEANNLQDQIKRTMEEADSLILHLRRRTENEDDLISQDEEEAACGGEYMSKAEITKLEGSKWPKDDRTVIEELRTLSQQLRSLVSQLVNQLSECTKETEMLRERVRYLEGEIRMKTEDMEGRGFMPLIRKDNLRVNTDSNGGSSSFECSPCSELSPDVATEPALMVPSRELPVLAPLEMPSFDWTMFSRKPDSIDQSPSS